MLCKIVGFYLTSGYTAVIFSAHLITMKCKAFTTTSTREIQLYTQAATQLTCSPPLPANQVHQSNVCMDKDLSERDLFQLALVTGVALKNAIKCHSWPQSLLVLLPGRCKHATFVSGVTGLFTRHLKFYVSYLLTVALGPEVSLSQIQPLTNLLDPSCFEKASSLMAPANFS